MNELKEETRDLMTQLAHAKEEIEVLQEEVDNLTDSRDEAVKEAYDEGYAAALDDAKLAVEDLQ